MWFRSHWLSRQSPVWNYLFMLLHCFLTNPFTKHQPPNPHLPSAHLESQVWCCTFSSFLQCIREHPTGIFCKEKVLASYSNICGSEWCFRGWRGSLSLLCNAVVTTSWRCWCAAEDFPLTSFSLVPSVSKANVLIVRRWIHFLWLFLAFVIRVVLLGSMSVVITLSV